MIKLNINKEKKSKGTPKDVLELTPEQLGLIKKRNNLKRVAEFAAHQAKAIEDQIKDVARESIWNRGRPPNTLTIGDTLIAKTSGYRSKPDATFDAIMDEVEEDKDGDVWNDGDKEILKKFFRKKQTVTFDLSQVRDADISYTDTNGNEKVANPNDELHKLISLFNHLGVVMKEDITTEATPSFVADRYNLLTPEQNKALDAHIPLGLSICAKNNRVIPSIHIVDAIGDLAI